MIDVQHASTNSGGGRPMGRDVPELEGDTIAGLLSCTGNSPSPIDDNQPDTSSGQAIGQCAGPGF